MGGKHHHHHHGGRRFGRRFGVDVIDSAPDYVTSDCYREVLPDGTIRWRCPPEGIAPSMGDASYPIGYYKESDAMGDAGELSDAVHPLGPDTRWFRRQGFSGLTLDMSPDYVTNNGYRQKLKDGTWRWVMPNDPKRRIKKKGDAGDILPTLVTADTARAYIAETDTGYNTLDTTITSAGVPPEFLAAWKATYLGWKAFSNTTAPNVSFFTAKAAMDQTDRWVETLGKFSVQFHNLSPSSPVPTMPSAPGQGIPDKSAASLISGTTGLIVAGAVLAAVLFVGPHFSK
jgi:hypothetical protein